MGWETGGARRGGIRFREKGYAAVLLPPRHRRGSGLFRPGTIPRTTMRENRQPLPDSSDHADAAPVPDMDFALIGERVAKDRALAEGFLALSISGALAGAVLAAAIKDPVPWWIRWEPMLGYSLAGTSFLLSAGYSLRISLLKDRLRALRRMIPG
jgi:hypothetical protein